jgi:DNA-binding transcriptional ArsR family regulator
VLADADLAAVGRMLGDSHRARFVLALVGGEELTAGELAARSGASSSLASAHLTKLLEAGLVRAEKRGRERHYRMASPQVAQAVEGLLAIAPARKATGLRESARGKAIQRARTCYDHLAGELGVSLVDAMEHERLLDPLEHGWGVTARGERRLGQLGLELGALRRAHRTFIRPCLDWTQRRPHVAGALGAAITQRFFELGWIERLPGSRAVRVTPQGERELLAHFAIRV